MRNQECKLFLALLFEEAKKLCYRTAQAHLHADHRSGAACRAFCRQGVSPLPVVSEVQPCLRNKEDVRTLNSYLDTLDRDIEKAHTDLTKEGAMITAKAIKNKYLVSRKGHITSWRYLQTTIKKWKRYLAKDLSRILLKAIEHQPLN